MTTHKGGTISLIDKIIESIESLKTLEIRTVVGNYRWDEQEGKIKYKNEEVKVAMTQIDLLDGDITTVFSEDFLKEPYNTLLDFHAEREKRGQEIIQGNLKELNEFIVLVVNANKHKQEAEKGE